MHSPTTHLLVTSAEHAEQVDRAAARRRAVQVVRLRRLDRRAEAAASRARLVRHVLG